jgi:hypothetical protein
MLTKDYLYEQYIELGKPSTVIALECDVSPKTIRNYLHKYNIPLRTKTECSSGHYNANYGKRGEESHLYGIKRSEETKQKMSENNAQHRPEVREKSRQAKIGEKNPMFGKENKWGTHSEESKEKMSISHTGEKNPNWKPPAERIEPLNNQIRNCAENKKWRTSVFIRDNFTCQICGVRMKKDIEADHIKPFAQIKKENNITTLEEALLCKELWDITNGRTLCKTCHKISHQKTRHTE